MIKWKKQQDQIAFCISHLQIRTKNYKFITSNFSKLLAINFFISSRLSSNLLRTGLSNLQNMKKNKNHNLSWEKKLR